MEDRDEVLSFCVGTFDWGDYIDEVYDVWLNGSDSLLLVAEAEGKPVGILHARLMNHGRAWLEGLRVRPSHRRMGVGRALTEEAFEVLRRTGHRSVRLLIESNNEASKALALGQGFAEETRWAFYHGKEPAQMGSKAHWVTLSAAPGIWQVLDSSDLFNGGGRSYEYDWGLYPLEEDDFNELVKRKAVAVSGKGSTMALAIVHDRKEEREARACFVMGNPPEVGDLAAFVMSAAARVGAKRFFVSCPNRAGPVEGLKGFGFRPAFRSSIVFVKEI
jgi:GNAT superfamily N-acetyltransferase